MENVHLKQVLKNTVSRETEGYYFRVLQAGHFMLNYQVKGNSNGMMFVADDHNISLRDFSEVTWDVGRELVGSGNADRLLILVNDWQELEPLRSNIKDHMLFQELKNEALLSYYEDNPALPHCLRTHPIPKEFVEKRNKDCWMFSESALRDEFYVNVVKDLEPRFDFIRKTREHGKNYVKFYQTSADMAEFHNQDDYTLLCENTTDCAGEVVQLLKELKKRSVDCFVNFYPASCWRYVNIGCLIAKSILSRDREMKVVNVAIGEGLGDNNIKVNVYHV